MQKKIEHKLELANKLIFVKDYSAAKEVLLDVVSSEEGKDNLLVHLRLCELSMKIDRIQDFLLFYDEMYQVEAFSERVHDFSIAFLKQHGEMVSPEESVECFIRLLDRYPGEAAAYFSIGYGLELMSDWDRALSNYERALAGDPDWYPCYFGMSQVYYQLNQDEKGDHFFYLYENMAPYNLYGNFETHKKLCDEFLEADSFEYADSAVDCLTEWWDENKGSCPIEIRIFVLFAKARIYYFQGEKSSSSNFRREALKLVDDLIARETVQAKALYFIAKVLEDHSEFQAAFEVYRKVLASGDVDASLIQRIGSQFLTLGQNELAYKLFDEAYRQSPSNREISFGRLVSRLREKRVDVESYLQSREVMQSIVKGGGDQVELLATVHRLLSQFDEDPEVHHELAILLKSMGNEQRATEHIQKMLSLDGFNPQSALRGASYFLAEGKVDRANDSLLLIHSEESIDDSHQEQYFWIKTTIFIENKDFASALLCLDKLLEEDCWNVSYLVQLIYCKMQIGSSEPAGLEDSLIDSLVLGDDKDLDWQAYDNISKSLLDDHKYELNYLRQKLRYLYSRSDASQLDKLVQDAVRWDPVRCGNELIRLLNTNFDCPEIYIALAGLYAEQWLLQASSMWAEHALRHPKVTNGQKQKIYLMLADNYLWEKSNTEKALQYASFAYELGRPGDVEANRVLGHAFLIQGKAKQARTHLEKCDGLSLEESYLKGLLEYRNGAVKQANAIWKPLLTMKSTTLKHHHVKQELLKYYFDAEQYLKAN